MLKKKWFWLGVGGLVMAVLGGVVAIQVKPESTILSLGDQVMLADGAVNRQPQAVPLTAAEATTEGWTQQGSCVEGKGRYFKKGTQGQIAYLLTFNADDELIGLYLFSKEELPSPWDPVEQLVAAGATLLDFAHWSLPVYFLDPQTACTKTVV
jgi:hypothetical protein